LASAPEDDATAFTISKEEEEGSNVGDEMGCPCWVHTEAHHRRMLMMVLQSLQHKLLALHVRVGSQILEDILTYVAGGRPSSVGIDYSTDRR
jgi:hypothetical protein